MNFAGFAIVNTVLWPMYAHGITEPSSHDHAFNHFRTCADEAVVAMMVGWPEVAQERHRCPRRRTGERFLPICAQEPTVPEVSTIVPSS